MSTCDQESTQLKMWRRVSSVRGVPVTSHGREKEATVSLGGGRLLTKLMVTSRAVWITAYFPAQRE